jgi:hypothetical protein
MIFKKKRKIEQLSPTKANFNDPWFYKEDASGIYTIAIVLDGKVQDLLKAEIKLAAMLLSDPILVDVSKESHHPHIGWEYNEETGEFNDPNKDQEIKS